MYKSAWYLMQQIILSLYDSYWRFKTWHLSHSLSRGRFSHNKSVKFCRLLMPLAIHDKSWFLYNGLYTIHDKKRCKCKLRMAQWNIIKSNRGWRMANDPMWGRNIVCGGCIDAATLLALSSNNIRALVGITPTIHCITMHYFLWLGLYCV